MAGLLGGAASPGPATLQRAPLFVRVATPDAVALVGLHGELEARLPHGAGVADRLGLRLAGLALELGFAVVGAEEETVVIGTTGGVLLLLELLVRLHHRHFAALLLDRKKWAGGPLAS